MACNELPNEKPYWNYEDIGVFFLVVILIGFTLRLLVRFHLLARSELNHPSVCLRFAVVASLILTLYLVLKLRHRRYVLRPLGWVWPTYDLCARRPGRGSVTGLRRCALFALLPSRHAADWAYGSCCFWPFHSGRILEESFFRGWLLPLGAQTTGLHPCR